MKSLELTPQSAGSVMQVLQSEQPVLMLCHANWCPHCVAMRPTWKLMKTQLGNADITVVEVEYDNMGLLPSRLQNIRGFPTIQVVKNGKVKSQYQGERSLDGMLTFALANAKKVRTAKSSSKPATSPKKKVASKPLKKKTPQK